MDEELQWYVVRSQTKREKSAAAYIRKELGLEVIAPQVSYIKSTRRGKILWREAMFPGYLFVKLDIALSERAVCYAPGVLKLVKFGSYIPHIEESFVLGLRDTLSNEEELNLEHQVNVGEKYELSTGPMKGLEGKVIEVMSGGDRVKMLLNFIGEERTVDIDIYSLLLSNRPSMDD